MVALAFAVAFAFVVSLSAALAQAPSITINGNSPEICNVIPGTLYCAPRTLAWNKGNTNYQRYAIYRLKSDNCIGADSSYPGVQIACPVPGVSSFTIYPSISAAGCQAIYRYALVGSNKLCATMQEGDGEFFIPAQTWVEIYP